MINSNVGNINQVQYNNVKSDGKSAPARSRSAYGDRRISLPC